LSAFEIILVDLEAGLPSSVIYELGMSQMDPSAAISEAKELIALCRAGRLFEIEKWIAEGKSLDISEATRRGRQRSLLEITIEIGFHSLVELIAKNESSQTVKNAALSAAVSSRRLDLVELLLANGAEITAVPLADVLLTWEPKLIHFFLDHGADPVKGRPFAEAFGTKVRTALRPFVEYKRAHPELAPQLQEQLDCALRHFCGEGDLKWVSLLMWAGGDPRSRGPCLEKEYTEDPECFTSGLEEACHAENLDMMKKLKPDPSRDNLPELLYSAALLGRSQTLEYLLELGGSPNNKVNGGSSALDAALHNMKFAGFNPYASKGIKSKYDVSQSLESVRKLLAHGAIWNPDGNDEMNWVRRALVECEPDVTIELLLMFRKHNACPAERVHGLLGTPRMKEHLKAKTEALLRLGIHLESRAKASRLKIGNR
jgi:hypothetical protein